MCHVFTVGDAADNNPLESAGPSTHQQQICTQLTPTVKRIIDFFFSGVCRWPHPVKREGVVQKPRYFSALFSGCQQTSFSSLTFSEFIISLVLPILIAK